jgi:hypothetical protein
MEILNYSWAQFKQNVDSLVTSKLEWLFRGHSDSRWPLQSTWHRLIGTDVDFEVYPSIIRTVHDYVRTWTGTSWDLENNADVLSFLGYVRHHGFPTPLLDWSRSTYIAAYFAFSGVDTKNCGPSTSVSVFAFDYQHYKQHWPQEQNPFFTEPQVSVLTTRARGNHNQILQQGVYTCGNVPDQGEFIGKRSPPAYAMMYRGYVSEFQIPASDAVVALRDLQLMGIGALSMFRSVEGLCVGLKEQLITGRLESASRDY